MQPVPADDLTQAIQSIEVDGFVVLENGVSEAEAAKLADLVVGPPEWAPGVWWVGRLTPDNYPIRRSVWETLPPDAKTLTRHQLEWSTDFHGELNEAIDDDLPTDNR